MSVKKETSTCSFAVKPLRGVIAAIRERARSAKPIEPIKGVPIALVTKVELDAWLKVLEQVR